MATQEDFSFPTTTDTPPRFIESPRLWRTTSLASSPHETTPKGDDHDHEEDFNFFYQSSKKGHNSMHQRKSFSHIECGTKRIRSSSTTGGGDHDQDCIEDKMDMLWEDFNEEFSRNSHSLSSRDDSDHHFHDHHQHVSHGKMLNFGCVHSLKLSKPNRRPSMVVFMKVLKKMLKLQNSHRTIKRSQ